MATVGQASVVAYLLRCSQNGLACIRPAAYVLLAGVDVITVRIDDVPNARAYKLRRVNLLQLGNRHTKMLTEA